MTFQPNSYSFRLHPYTELGLMYIKDSAKPLVPPSLFLTQVIYYSKKLSLPLR